MPIDARQAARIAQRFRGMQSFPSVQEALDELVGMIAARISSDRHASAFATEVLENLDYCPTPRQAAEIAKRTMPADEKSRFGCPKCSWTGFVEATLTVNGRTAPAVDFCECREQPAEGWREDEWRPSEADSPAATLDSARRAANRAWAENVAADLAKTCQFPAES